MQAAHSFLHRHEGRAVMPSSACIVVHEHWGLSGRLIVQAERTSMDCSTANHVQEQCMSEHHMNALLQASPCSWGQT